MIRVWTPSRLHFGLFSTQYPLTGWTNQEGHERVPARLFGGVGLMVDQPGLTLTAAPAKSWSSDGPLAERAMRFATGYCERVGIKQAFQLRIESAPLEHIGLGTGTQLGLAVARAIAELTEQPWRDALTLAPSIGRGHRSALGLHGFDHGGFLIDGGRKNAAGGPGTLLARHEFPDDWHVLLITPHDLIGTHGREESEAFDSLTTRQPYDVRTTDTLCRLALLGMLPAVIERDLRTFAEALYDFNRRVGELFMPVQGGIYAHPRLDEIVKDLRDIGETAVGQSSWGPTIFVITAPDLAESLRKWMMRKHGLTEKELVIAMPCNHGAVVTSPKEG